MVWLLKKGLVIDI